MNSPAAFSRPLLAAALTAALSCAWTTSARAAGAIFLEDWDNGAGKTPSIGVGATLSAERTLPKSSYSDNQALFFSAWAHAGPSWFVFNLTSAANTTIRLGTSDPLVAFKPGLTVWTSGSSLFDGGTDGVPEISDAGWNSPHSFNAVGQVGAFGTYWMSTDGVATYGNMVQTLAYAVTGPSRTTGTGWSESIQQGVHDISTDDVWERGITGSSGANWLELSFNQLQPGWYVLFAGGTDHSLTAQNLTLSLTTAPVPEPQTWALLAAGLGMVALLRRRRRSD